jgi:hypothetical protein
MVFVSLSDNFFQGSLKESHIDQLLLDHLENLTDIFNVLNRSEIIFWAILSGRRIPDRL